VEAERKEDIAVYFSLIIVERRDGGQNLKDSLGVPENFLSFRFVPMEIHARFLHGNHSPKTVKSSCVVSMFHGVAVAEPSDSGVQGFGEPQIQCEN
jgi:hypothetical protein